MIFGLFKKGSTRKKPERKDVKEVRIKPDECKCPYCLVSIKPAPKRKKMCSNCEELIYPRKHYKTKQYIYLKEIDLKKYEKEKNDYYKAKALLRSIVGQLGLNKSKVDNLIENREKELTKKFGKKASYGDAVWSYANELVAKKGSGNYADTLQFSMALYLQQIGKKSDHIRTNIHLNDLKRYKKSNVVKRVEIITAKELSCDNCRKLEGTKITVEDAIKNSPLPCKDCTHNAEEGGEGWCRCVYTPLLD